MMVRSTADGRQVSRIGWLLKADTGLVSRFRSWHEFAAPSDAKFGFGVLEIHAWSHFLSETGNRRGSSPGQAFSGKCSDAPRQSARIQQHRVRRKGVASPAILLHSSSVSKQRARKLPELPYGII